MPGRLVALTLLVALTSIILVACGSSDAESPTAVPPTAVPEATTAPTTPSQPPDGSTIINLQDPGGSGSYAFSSSDLTFSVGETVTFALISETEFHTFTVDDLDIDQDVDAGETVSLTFTFDTPGTFDLICIPHELLGMVGTITVQ